MTLKTFWPSQTSHTRPLKAIMTWLTNFTPNYDDETDTSQLYYDKISEFSRTLYDDIIGTDKPHSDDVTGTANLIMMTSLLLCDPLTRQKWKTKWQKRHQQTSAAPYWEPCN